MSLLNPESTFLQTKQGNHDANGHDSSPELKNIVANITESLKGISSAFTVYNECSDHLLALPSQYPSFQDDVVLFSQEIKEREQFQRNVLDEIDGKISDDIKKEVLVALEDQLFGVIKEEAASMVKKEVDKQIRDYLPVSLREQAEASRKQLRDIKISLENSAARTHNSFIELGHLEDPLKHVFTPDGESSPYYPANLKMLFAYDLDSVKALNKDYGLVESDNIRLHFQQFLKHVGTKVDVVTHDSDDAEQIKLNAEI